jgi:hypothetical protein
MSESSMGRRVTMLTPLCKEKQTKVRKREKDASKGRRCSLGQELVSDDRFQHTALPRALTSDDNDARELEAVGLVNREEDLSDLDELLSELNEVRLVVLVDDLSLGRRRESSESSYSSWGSWWWYSSSSPFSSFASFARRRLVRACLPVLLAPDAALFEPPPARPEPLWSLDIRRSIGDTFLDLRKFGLQGREGVCC